MTLRESQNERKLLYVLLHSVTWRSKVREIFDCGLCIQNLAGDEKVSLLRSFL